MIEEELSPIYAPLDAADEQQPKPELPQKMGDPLGDIIAQPAFEKAEAEEKKLIQEEFDKKQAEINLRRGKDKMIRSEILGGDEHTDEDKMRLMREWVTNTTGEAPKSYTQFEMGLDKAWKASGREGIAPDFKSTFDVIKGKLHEDEQKRKLDESYFNKGTKSIFAPELYSIDRSFAQQDVTPEERRILTEMHKQGAKAQVERYGEKMITDIKMVMDSLGGGVEPEDVMNNIVAHTREMSSEDKALFVAGLREAMMANPTPKVESFANNLGLAWQSGKITLGMIPDWLSKEAAAANVNLARYQQQLSTEHSPLRVSPTGGLVQSWFDRDKEQTGIAADAVDNYKDVVHDADMKMELRYLFGKEYDPIVPLAREGTMLRYMEEGLYGVPSVGASIAVVSAPLVAAVAIPSTAPAMLKASAVALSGVAGYALSASEIEENKRQGFLRGGSGFDEASMKADSFSTYAQALPHYMIERFQVGSLLGRTKVTKAIYNKLNSTLRNRGLRYASKFAGQVAMQTAEEMTQDIYSNMVNDMISVFDEEMGDVVWKNGEDGVFDEFWSKSMVTMFSMSPFAATSAAGGFSAEERAAAWAELPPLMLESYGYRKSDIDYVNEAASPAERVERVAEAELNRDPFSEEAKDATQEIAEAAMRQQQAIEEMQRAGQFPAMEVTFAEGRPNIKVTDPENGEVILETDNYGEATETAFSWLNRQADADSAEFMYLNTMLKAAGRMAQDSPASQQILELGNTMTKAKMIAENQDSAQRIREQSERNERLYGNDAVMTELVFGSNVVGVNEAGQTQVINRLFEGASINTLIHETGHAKFKEGLQNGSINYDEVVATLKRIDKALEGRMTKEIKHGKHVRQSEDMTFLKGKEKPSFMEVDEAMAELWEAMILGEGRMGSMREIIKEGLTSYAKMGLGDSVRNFISALRYYFNLALSRVFALKKAVREGEIDQKDIDKLRAMMQGTTVQEELEADAQREFDETIRPALEEESFALEPDPYRDRVGEDQGKPLTKTEIEEGIEDESGTLADVEVDGDKLADIGFEGDESSFSLAPEWRMLKPEDVRGKKLFGFYADRMRVGTYTGLDPESGINIDCQGGIDYPLAHEGAAWAVSNDSMHSAIANAADARDGIAVVFAYQTGNITGNETFALAYTEELKWAVKSGKISEERALEILNKVRGESISLYETLQKREQKKADAKAEREGKDPVKKALAPWAIKNKDAWKSLDEFFDSLLKENGGTFDSRGDKMFRTGLDVKGLVTAQKLGANNYVKEGMPDITQMVKLLEVDNSSDINTGDVLGLVEIDKGQAGNAVSAEDIGVQPHRSYSRVITGRAYGKLPKRVNVLDFFDPRKGALPLAGEVLKMKEEARVAELEEVSFSIGRAEITPTANTQVFPTKDGGVVGEASFSISAFHGTPHKVDKFRAESIGTGEGAQAYGWGLYFAESAEVAENYRIRLAYDPDKQRINGRQINDEYSRYTRGTATEVDYQIAEGLERLMMHDSPAEVIEMFKEYGYSEKAIKYFEESDYETFGGLYSVELNVEQDELLDWDKPITKEQAAFIESLPKSSRVGLDDVINYEPYTTLIGSEFYWFLKKTAGDGGLWLDQESQDMAEVVSRGLSEMGIKGIKYLDGDSRGAGEGTYNYVIFNDADITIKTENGQEVDTTSFSISPAQDANYMEAVESGDMEAAQSMVDQAARKAGYGRFFYHGTDKDSKQDILTGGVDQYKSEKGYFGRGFYTATDKQLAIDNYAEFADDEIGGDVIGVAIADTATVLDLSMPEGFETYKNLKYRGVPVEGLVGEDNFHEIMTSLGVDALADNSFGGVVVYNERVLKTTDPVTYDSDGNVIPLSQRFDPSRDEISYSMGVPYASILGSAQRRIKSPEVKVSILGDVQRRVQKLITDSNRLKIKDDFKEERMMKSLRKEGAMRQALRRDELEKEGMQPAEARRQAIEETDKWLNQEVLDIEKNQRKRLRDMLVTYEAILLALPTNIRGKMGSAVKLADVRTEEQILKFFDKKLDKLEKVVDSWVSKNFDRSAKKLFDRALAKKAAGKKDKGRLGAAIHRVFDAADKARFELDDEAKVDGAVAEIEATINSKISADQLTPEEENELETKLNMVQLFGNWRNLDNADKEAALKYGWREFEYAFLLSKIRKAEEREEMERKANELISATGIPIEKIEEEADKRREGYGKWFGRIKAASYNFWDFEQVLSSVFPDAKQVVDKVIQEQQADATFNDRMREHQEGIENLFASLAGDDLFGVKALKLQDKMQSIFFEVNGGGIKRQLTQMEMIQARLMWRQEDGRRHMENWDKEDKRNYSQEFMDALEKQMTPEAFAVEDYLIAEYEKEYDRLNEIHERVNGVSLPRNNMYSPLTVSPLQSLKNDQMADPITGQAVDSIDGSNPSLLRRSKTAAAKPVFRDALRTFYAHKNQVEYWMAYAEFLKELRSLMGNRDIRDAAEARGGHEALTMLQKWVDVLSNHGIKTSALSSQFNSFIGRSTNRAASAILAGRLSVLAIQSTQIGAALAQMPTKDYVWRLGKLLSGQLNYKEAFNSDFIQRRIKQAPPAVRMAMEGMASGKPNIAKAAAEKMGTLISGADAFFTSGTYAIIYDYLTTKKGMASAEAHTEATRLTEQVAQPTRMARRSMIEIQQSKIAIAKLSWAFASETRQKIALSAYRFAHAKSWEEKARAMAVTWGFGGAFASIVRAVSADLRDDDDEEVFDEKYWNPTRMVLQSLLPPLTGIPVYGEMAEIGLMTAAKLAGLETGYIFDGDSMISSVKDFPKAAFNIYGTSRDVIGGDEEAEKLIKDIDKLLISIAPLFDTAAAASSFSHVVRDLFMLGKNAID